MYTLRVLLLGLFVTLAQSALGAPIVNGNFETGDLTGWRYVCGGAFSSGPRCNIAGAVGAITRSRSAPHSKRI